MTMRVRLKHMCGLPLLCIMYLWLDTIILASRKTSTNLVVVPQLPANTISNLSMTTEPPIFFLHVGPHKTGTTTIQNSFDSNPLLLKKDHYKFLGMRNPPKIRDSFGVRTGLRAFQKTHSTVFLDNLKQELQQPSNHIIVSSEDFSLMLNSRDKEGTLFYTLLKRLVGRNYRIHVAVGYRRYYEWIVSLYNELRKFFRHRESFVQWFRKGISSRHQYCHKVYQAMQKYFHHVDIINVHEQELMTNVYCNIMENASYSCQWHQEELRKSNDTTTRDNPSVPMWPLAIADEAIHRRLSSETNVTILAVQVQEFATEINYQLPLHCLTKREQAQILQLSLRFEKLLQPDFFHSPRGQVELRKGFDSYVENDKFCSVNLRRVFQDEQWRNFFQRGMGLHAGDKADRIK